MSEGGEPYLVLIIITYLETEKGNEMDENIWNLKTCIKCVFRSCDQCILFSSIHVRNWVIF